MSTDELAVMDGGKCILPFLKAVTWKRRPRLMPPPIDFSTGGLFLSLSNQSQQI